MLIEWFLSIKSLPNLLFGVLCLPGDQSHPVCATDNKPSCMLHLLGWFIGSCGFSSLERRPEFWVLQGKILLYVDVSLRNSAEFRSWSKRIVKTHLMKHLCSLSNELSIHNVSDRHLTFFYVLNFLK